jgi:hypothetical protein
MLEARVLDRLARRLLGEVDDVDALGRAAPGDDPRALTDPLVGGLDGPRDVVVRHDELAAHGAEPHDARELGTARLVERRSSHLSS